VGGCDGFVTRARISGEESRHLSTDPPNCSRQHLESIEATRRESMREERGRAGLSVSVSVYRDVLAVKDEGGAPSPPAAVFDP
jgi:hypothetical protein